MTRAGATGAGYEEGSGVRALLALFGSVLPTIALSIPARGGLSGPPTRRDRSGNEVGAAT